MGLVVVEGCCGRRCHCRWRTEVGVLEGRGKDGGGQLLNFENMCTRVCLLAHVCVVVGVEMVEAGVVWEKKAVQ